MSRPPSLGSSSRAPLSAASASSVKGPARSKKRGSAIAARSPTAAASRYFFFFGVAAAPAAAAVRRWRAGGDRRDEVDRQGRQLLVELLQHLVGHVKTLVEQHQIAALEHQIGFPFLGNFGDDLQHRFLNLFERFAIGFLQSLAFALHVAVELVDLLLEIASLLVQRFGRKRGLLPLQRVALVAQRLFLVRNLLGVFAALLLDLLAHHLRRFRVLQQRLNVDDHHGQGRRGAAGAASGSGGAGGCCAWAWR